MDIKLAHGRTGRIGIHRGDDPKILAQNFANAFHLDAKLTGMWREERGGGEEGRRGGGEEGRRGGGEEGRRGGEEERRRGGEEERGEGRGECSILTYCIS